MDDARHIIFFCLYSRSTLATSSSTVSTEESTLAGLVEERWETWYAFYSDL